MFDQTTVQSRLDTLSGIVLDSAIHVHRELGPGLLESIYQCCLYRELSDRSLKVEEQVPIKLTYKGMPLSKDFRIDLLVEDCIIVELKCCETLLPIHTAQLLSYLKLSSIKLGLLINFNVPILKSGFKRVVRNY